MIVTTAHIFQKSMKKYFKQIKDQFEELVITSPIGDFVIMDKKRYDTLKETEYIFSNSVIITSIQNSLKQIKKGETKKVSSSQELFNKLEI
ncbi:type II toxin-antitoxin system Phd/YefM family antitoxin [Flammeovirga aprica]|uniref:Prevent-host-death protein n=1 Tax=Flammeovirga aprica JL-4 TaxID=694437 RepID=A0A7X9P3B7_9BACT|nr:hypothetical protein [Flammeovirga aprica]NME67859.1 hypothetical protein [Flammeovirga aprica JL-4]